VAPALTLQPLSETVNSGASAAFWVTATGSSPLSYQWYLNGSAILGATNSLYLVPSALASSAGTYTATVANGAGSVTSTAATLTVSASATGNSVSLIHQPLGQTAGSGSTVAFRIETGATVTTTSVGETGLSVRATSASTYQWFFDGVAISGATDSTYVLGDVTAVNNGSYSCVVTTSAGALESSTATLNVVGATVPSRLVNLSCRAEVGTGASQLIAGFVVGGQGTLGQEPVLIRASGPALTAYSITGVLSDPDLTLNSSSGFLATNDGWSGNTQVLNTALEVGAFSWTSATSHDSALNESFSAGAYTAEVSGASGDTGVALAEVYDATLGVTGTSPRLINFSARNQVGTGSKILIAGFVIGGTTSKTVLIRGSGPALAAFGVQGTLSDPALQLFRSNSDGTSTLMASNTGWGGDSVLASTAASVGAFSWGTAATGDSAILITLAPGAYTAEVSGASGDTGIALAEVYEVP